MLTVEKRDGRQVEFDAKKIVVAIEKAMNSSTGIYGRIWLKKSPKKLKDMPKQLEKF